MSGQRASPKRAGSTMVLLLLAAAAGVVWLWPYASGLVTRLASMTGPSLALPSDPRPDASIAPPPIAFPTLPDPFAPDAHPPSFDVVRISPAGNAVIAGQGEPGAEVTLKDGDKVLGRVRADRQGNWVLVPDAPLTEGGRELSVSEIAPDGSETLGRDTVLLSIPRRASGGTASALLVPHEGEARLLQAGAMPVVPGPATSGPATPGAASSGLLTPGTGPAAPVPMALPAQTVVPSSRTIVRPGPAPSKLGLATVDYTEQGAIRFAGTAAPSAPVRVYVDDAMSGDATADASGNWGLVPRQAVSGGLHRLRIDQLSAAGRVVARVELPFERSVLPPEVIASGRVVVQPGQNLWRMARKVYGSGVRYTIIYLANQDQIRNPKLIYPGQAFAVPNP